MGLDLHVKWGWREGSAWPEWYEQWGRWHDYHAATFTGLPDTPESGYLRESWTSYDWVVAMAERYNAPDPYEFFPEWKEESERDMDLSNGRLDEVLAFRDNILIPWLARSNGTRYSLEGEERKDFERFQRRVGNVVGFINFIQCHRDKPNLTVVFG